MRTLALLALLVPALASAVPLELQHQARLFDSAGVPLSGATNVTLSLYDAPTAGSVVWTEAQSVVFTEGYGAMRLGADPTNPLDLDIIDGTALFLAIAVNDGAELSQRLPILSVPHAIRAHTATNLKGGVVDATEIRVGGQVVISADGAVAGDVAWNQISGVPAGLSDGDDDALGGLSCDNGDVLVWNGADWACGGAESVDASVLAGTVAISALPVGGGATQVAAGDHAHSFGQITGQAAFGQLPVGAGATQVAAGDHAHAFSEITGSAAIGQLPVGTGATQVARGDHTHTAAQVGALPIGGGTLTGTVTAPGVRVANPGDACGSGQAGMVRFKDGAFEGCDGATWVNLGGGSDGASASRAAQDCKALHTDFPALASGVYWIDTDGTGSQAPFQVWCDMTTSGGGWTTAFVTRRFMAIVAANPGVSWQNMANRSITSLIPSGSGIMEGHAVPAAANEVLWGCTADGTDANIKWWVTNKPAELTDNAHTSGGHTVTQLARSSNATENVGRYVEGSANYPTYRYFFLRNPTNSNSCESAAWGGNCFYESCTATSGLCASSYKCDDVQANATNGRFWIMYR